MLLKDGLDNILLSYDINITEKGEDILKKLSNNERMINYKNLFFRAGNPAIDNYDMLKRFGTFYGLLVDLLNKEIDTIKASKVVRNFCFVRGRKY